MSYGKITTKQLEILEYIKSQILERGYPPAVREICEAVNLKSTSSVHSHLKTRDGTGTDYRSCCGRRTASRPGEHRRIFPDSCRIYAEQSDLHAAGTRRKHDKCRNS